MRNLVHVRHLALLLSSVSLLAACGSSTEPEPAASDASAASEAAAEAQQMGTEDALVAGTDYNATTQVPCSTDGSEPKESCDAGVKRNWGDTPGENLVEVTKPDGTKRAIFFKGTEAYSADSAQADGSAGWDFKATRDADNSVIVFGPERYIIPDALVEGG